MKKTFYSVPDYIKLLYSFLLTKIFFHPARIIRQPVRIKGWPKIKIGSGFTTGQFCRLEALAAWDDHETLIFGDNVQINDACHIASYKRVEIGNNVLIASRVYISDHDHGDFSKKSLSLKPAEREIVQKDVFIEDSVWVGEGVSILKGVRIGKGSVIGAGAVVTKNVPPYSLVAGVPAKVIKRIL